MMAVEASGHFEYAIGVTHMHIIMRVADKLRRDKKPQGVAVAYDRLARYELFLARSPPTVLLLFCLRKDLASKSSCEYPGWSLIKAVKEIDTDIYDRALEEFGRGARETKDDTVQNQGVRFPLGLLPVSCEFVSVVGEAKVGARRWHRQRHSVARPVACSWQMEGRLEKVQ